MLHGLVAFFPMSVLAFQYDAMHTWGTNLGVLGRTFLVVKHAVSVPGIA